MKNQFSIILFFIISLSSQTFAIDPEFYQRGEEYKDYPSWVKSPYDVAFYVMTNYDELSKKEGYIIPLPIIPDDEIEKIKNAKTLQNDTSNQH